MGFAETSLATISGTHGEELCGGGGLGRGLVVERLVSWTPRWESSAPSQPALEEEAFGSLRVLFPFSASALGSTCSCVSGARKPSEGRRPRSSSSQGRPSGPPGWETCQFRYFHLEAKSQSGRMSFRSLKADGDVQKPRRLEIRLGCQGGPVGGIRGKAVFSGQVLFPPRAGRAVSEMSLIVKFKV